MADGDGPAGVCIGTVEGEDGAATAVEEGLFDVPFLEGGGHVVESEAFADTAEVDLDFFVETGGGPSLSVELETEAFSEVRF